MSQVALIHTNNRPDGVRRALTLLGTEGPAGGGALLKPNYNSSDPSPGSTHNDVLTVLVQWLKEQGGLGAIERINTAKSQALYQAIDSTPFYRGTAEPGDRSKMNITFRLPTEELEKMFVAEAQESGMVGLKGHRSVGGIRASCYNAMPLDGVSRLIDFMTDFQSRHG